VRLVDLAALAYTYPGRPDEWGTYVLWDGDPAHPMKIGLSLRPESRLSIRRHLDLDLRLVLVTALDIETPLLDLFVGSKCSPEPWLRPGSDLKGTGWTEWVRDDDLVALVEGVGWSYDG
jgi:hypothetical protein